MPEALPAPDIPTRPEEVTPEWLTAVLRSRGHLGDGRVLRYRTETLGEGEGFVGSIVRFRLELDPPDAASPRSLIGKFPIDLDQNRHLGEALGAYEREVRFYSELADRFPIRKPACYFAAMDPNPLAGREEAVADFLDRLPRWLIRLLIPFFLWIATKSRRRYLILLEDLAPARVGDQVSGCTRDEAELALRAVAKLHAAWWERPALAELSWVPRVDMLVHHGKVYYDGSRVAFFEGLGARLPGRLREAADWLDHHAVELVGRLARAPRTLIHGDYRLDNLFFHDGPEPSVTAFDWQTVTRGPGVLDVAYFLSGSLRVEEGARLELELLRAWHEELQRHGVADYDFDACLLDYRRSQLAIAFRTIAGAELIDFSSERGSRLIAGWLERLTALLPDAYDELLV